MAESDKYEVLEKIGHGSFGIIRKVRRKTDNLVMCRKEISYLKMSQKEREQLHAEFQILSGLKHPNIVAYYHREHLKLSQDLHLYMEYCGNGDLGRVIKGLADKNQYAEEAFVWSIFSQLVTALFRCHYGVDPPEVGRNVVGLEQASRPRTTKTSMTILHRDLKPENVFLGDGNSVKLGDFGLSKMLASHDFASTYVGTPFYMSPEICAGERYTLKSDIWSLGCIMYELCAREPPFNARTHFDLVQKIKRGTYPALPKVYSSELSHAIKGCLEVNPDKRPDTAKLLDTPIVRLMRKEKEAVDLSQMLRNKEESLNKKMREFEHKIEAERHNIRQEIESTVRREWEVKARLEIDRLVNAEIEQLQNRFEAEVQARVQEELQKKTVTFGPAETQEFSSSEAKSDYPHSIGGASTDCEFPSTTDITELSVDSPEPAKKSARTPFGRAQTMFERNGGTPMDIEMGSPSPMAIASLSLSPRRNHVTKAPSSTQPTIFDEDCEDGNRWKTARDRLDEPHLTDSDDDDDGPMIPSPTRNPRSHKNPFGPQRPVLTSTKTAPINRLKSQASLGSTKSVPSLPPASASGQEHHQLHHQPSNGALRGTSPNRRLSKIPSAANLAPSSTGENGSGLQRKPSRSGETNSNNNNNKRDEQMPQQQSTGFVSKLAAKNNNVKGRTLIELQQARAGGRPVPGAAESAPPHANVSPKRNFRERIAATEPVAVWDPEKDEMPSPFLVRKKQTMARV